MVIVIISSHKGRTWKRNAPFHLKNKKAKNQPKKATIELSGQQMLLNFYMHSIM